MEEVKWRRRQGALMKGAVCAKTERRGPLAVGCGSTVKQGRQWRPVNKAGSVARV